MIIYADILIIVNTIVDYFILLLSATFSKYTYKNLRLVFGAMLGGVSSLYIFLPQQPILIELLYRCVIAVLITLIAFGYKKLKIFARGVFCFILASVIYGGGVMAIWLIFKPNSIVINNSYVYYDISATYLLIFSVIIYLIITVIKSLVRREAVTAKRCEVTLNFENKQTNIIGILDTGNSVSDFLGNAPIIFVSNKTFVRLFNNNFEIAKNTYQQRYRVIPCKTVNSDGLLEGLRCDSATIKTDGTKFHFVNPILLKNDAKFTDNYDAIINPEILLR